MARVLFNFKIVACFVLVFAAEAFAQNQSEPGNAVSPYPTIENLSIVWPISGDENENGSVAVRFRETDEANWRAAMPLVRVPAGSNCGFDWSNCHAGSLFGMQPDTEYTIELTLADPDGGDAVQTITASTRPWPVSPVEGKKVTPESIAEVVEGLSAGDVIVLADGNYGEINVRTSGTSEKPIVVRAENNQQAIVTGDVRIDGQSHVHIVGLTINGKAKFNDANNIVIQECHITTDRDGIVAYGEQVSQITVIGNTIVGPTKWVEKSIGAKGDNLGEGVVLNGPGHVVCYNRVESFRDGLFAWRRRRCSQPTFN